MDENCKHVIGIDANVSPSADPADGESSAMLVRHLFQQLSLMSEKIDQLNKNIDQQSREINFLRSELQQQRDRQEASVYNASRNAIQHELTKLNILPVEEQPSAPHVEIVVLMFSEYVNPDKNIQDKLRSYFRNMITEKKLFVKGIGQVSVRHGCLSQFVRYLMECMKPAKLHALLAKKNSPKITLFSKFITRHIMLRRNDHDETIPPRNLDTPIRRTIKVIKESYK